MKTTILAYVIALGGVAMVGFGLWGLYILIKERVAERRLMRDYIPTNQTIAVGFGLIGVAKARQGPQAGPARSEVRITYGYPFA
jgi:hypothetical protein